MEEFKSEFVQLESKRAFDPFSWESSVRLTLLGREGADDGMYLEERDGRKRKWSDGRGPRRDEEDREQRRVPPKKVLATVGDLSGGGGGGGGGAGSGGSSSSSSHMSPGWQVNDIDIEPLLPGELSMNEALLSLSAFKQEAPSPPSPSRRAWPRRDDRQISSMVVEGRDAMEEACDPQTNHMNITQHAGQEMQCGAVQNNAMMTLGYHSPTNPQENKNGGLLMCSPASSLDGFLPTPDLHYREDSNRFQYVLAAATSIATKTNEETLTYLNQGQPYEIKLKKLGDLAQFKGKILKSVIKICFHERRLQYMEREQIAAWHADRPGERIVEVDVPLSYGVIKVQHPQSLNALHVYWDPFKDVGVYIKVNCISTEFTAKKHGGEKGVPFRIQVETYFANDDNVRLHAAACQIKVFKLKGADRKHKQDREKVMRRPRHDLDKYQPGCDATVLVTLPNDALLSPPSIVSSPPYSPEMCVAPKSCGSPGMVTKPMQPALLSSPSQMKPIYCQDSSSDVKASSPQCHSPGAILPDLPQAAQSDDPEKNSGLSKEASSADTAAWLARHRFTQHATTFANFSGADLLRLSRDDIIQICGLADGIRLFNALHAKRIEPRVTLYVRAGSSNIYSALYLHTATAHELVNKLNILMRKECENVLVSGPNGAQVRLSDELVRHLPDHATFTLHHTDDVLLMTATH